MAYHGDSQYERRLKRGMALVSGSSYTSVGRPSTQKTIGDRLIPTRAGNNWINMFYMKKYKYKEGNQLNNQFGNGQVLNQLLANEMLGTEITNQPERQSKGMQMFQYNNRLESKCDANQLHSASPLGAASHKLLERLPEKRKGIVPTRVLNAPELLNNYDTDLLDWSRENMVGIGLGSSVYIWDPITTQTTSLRDDLALYEDLVTSVSWANRGSLLAVGTHVGFLEVWDTAVVKRIYSVKSHDSVVGALAWNADVLVSGGRDSRIQFSDIRCAHRSLPSAIGHKEAVRSLKWSPDGRQLASGGLADLLVWDYHAKDKPLFTLNEHWSAVRAVGWSPHKRGLLASGGVMEHDIKFWSTFNGKLLRSTNVGGEVHNLVWSSHSSELLSVQNSSKNAITVWQYPNLVMCDAGQVSSSIGIMSMPNRLALSNHLAMSPDGETILTGTNQEILILWKVLRKPRERRVSTSTRSVLDLYTSIR